MADKLSTLRAHGVKLSLGDFGTGYSSLAYSRRLPIDQLKIDQTFVRSMECSRSDAAIVHTIIALGHNLQMEVLAEGVETIEQLELLRAAGCDMFQGYLFGKPGVSDRLCADSRCVTLGSP